MKRLPLFVALVTLLVAAKAAADGTIYGCANARTGRVRMIITSPPTCRATEMPLSWNQVGQQGPTGAGGAVGPQQSPLGMWP